MSDDKRNPKPSTPKPSTVKPSIRPNPGANQSSSNEGFNKGTVSENRPLNPNKPKK